MTRLVATASLAALLGILLAAPAAGDRPPAEQYALHCSGCHGPEGRGVPGQIPGLHDLGPLLDVPGGREYIARVPGVAQAPVDDAGLAQLLNWILSELSGVDPHYRADEIRRWRAHPLRDPVRQRPTPSG